jgi:hypothetical protein
VPLALSAASKCKLDGCRNTAAERMGRFDSVGCAISTSALTECAATTSQGTVSNPATLLSQQVFHVRDATTAFFARTWSSTCIDTMASISVQDLVGIRSKPQCAEMELTTG